MLLIDSLQLATFVANILLGVLVLAKNPKASAHRVFAAVAFTTACWILFLFLTLSGRLDVVLMGRITFVFGSAMLAMLLWFVAEYPTRSKRIRFFQWLATSLIAVFTVLSLSPVMIQSVEIRIADGYAYIWGSFGKIYAAWLLFYFSTIFYTFFHAWRGVRRSRGLERRQFRSLMVGLTLFYVPMLVTQLVLPALGYFQWNSLGPVFSIFALIFIAQSMLSYRTFDIRWVFKWGLIIPAVVMTLIGIITFSVFLLVGLVSPTFSTLISALVITVAYRPLFTFIDWLVSKLVSRGQYVFREAVLDISHLSAEHLSLSSLHERLAELIVQFFKCERYAILTLYPNKTEVIALSSKGFTKNVREAVVEILDIAKVHAFEVLEKDELAWRLRQNVEPASAARDRRAVALLNDLKVDMAVPLTIKDVPVGLLLLGPKSSKEGFSMEDRRLFEVIRGTMAPALANAARFVEMQKLYGRLLELDRAKNDFINVVSHQFRTPLTAITWSAELAMGEDGLSAAQQKLLTTIQQRSNFLSLMLHRIFSMLALENRQLTVVREPLNLREVTDHVLKAASPMCQVKRIQMSASLEDATIYGDADKLETVIQVLVENACHYSRANGRIEVVASADKRKKQAILRVTDHGIGIPASELQHVFEKFFRGEQAKKALPDGTGISLYLSKQLVEKQGGTLEVESIPGKETVFTIKLPLAKA